MSNRLTSKSKEDNLMSGIIAMHKDNDKVHIVINELCLLGDKIYQSNKKLGLDVKKCRC